MRYSENFVKCVRYNVDPLYLYRPRFSFIIGDDIDFFIDDFPAFAFLPSGATIVAGILVTTWQELHVSRLILAKTVKEKTK